MSYVPQPPLPAHNHLEEVRVRQGWSRGALATQVGTDGAKIRAVEDGRLAPSMVLGLQLAAVLKVRVDDLFCLHDHEFDVVDDEDMDRLKGYRVENVPIGSKQPIWSEAGGATRTLLERKRRGHQEVVPRFDKDPELWVVYRTWHWLYVFPPAGTLVPKGRG